MGKPASPVAPEQVVAADLRGVWLSAPNRVYLDLGEPDARDMDAYTVANFRDLGEVTWSEDNASGWGIPYMRADLAASPEAAPAAMEGAPWNGAQSPLHQSLCMRPAPCSECDRIAALAATPAAPSAVTDEQIEDWITTLAAYDLAGPKLLGRDRIHRFARAILACAQPAPVQAGAQQAVADRYCNKCGYSGPDDLHFRPNGTGECGYFSMPRAAPTQTGAGDAKGGA